MSLFLNIKKKDELTWEERFPTEEFGQDAADRPHVNGGGVVGHGQHELRRAVPARRHVQRLQEPLLPGTRVHSPRQTYKTARSVYRRTKNALMWRTSYAELFNWQLVAIYKHVIHTEFYKGQKKKITTSLRFFTDSEDNGKGFRPQFNFPDQACLWIRDQTEQSDDCSQQGNQSRVVRQCSPWKREGGKCPRGKYGEMGCPVSSAVEHELQKWGVGSMAQQTNMTST